MKLFYWEYIEHPVLTIPLVSSRETGGSSEAAKE